MKASFHGVYDRNILEIECGDNYAFFAPRSLGSFTMRISEVRRLVKFLTRAVKPKAVSKSKKGSSK